MTTLARVRGLPRRAKLLLAANAVNSFGGGLVMPFLWIYLTQVRGLGIWVPATTLALQAATAVAGGLAWGAVMDRAPHRVVVPVALIAAGVGTSTYALAASPGVALAAAAIYGVGISGVGTAVRTMYADVAESPDRGLLYALDFGIFNAMTGLGVVFGGLIASAAVGSAVARYTALYLADGFTFALMGISVALLLPRGARPKPARGLRPRQSYVIILRDSRLFLIVAVMLLASFVSYGQLRSALPGYLTMTGAVGAGGLSATFALSIVAAVVAQFALLPHLERLPRARLVAASGVLFAACWMFVLLAGQNHGTAALTLAATGVALLSVGEVLSVPVLTALLNDLVDDRLRGQANALLSVSISGGAVLGPIVAGAALPWRNGTGLIVGLVTLSLLVPALVARLRMPPAQAREHAETAPTEVATIDQVSPDTAPAL